ncbi:hypothetical protein BJ165DRAFT_1410598 [Panaeolus papilionaceus]|nr:hypothetical protein BJ165DRAFT_1410598 [Panaeolus papilionaceus]
MKTPTFLSFLPLLVTILTFAFAEGRPDFRFSSASKRATTPTGNGHMLNGERLRRGLPPTIPKRLFNPSRVQAREPNPSNVPTTYQGYIKVVRASDNAPLGYIPSQYQSPPPSSYSWYGVGDSRLRVKFTPPVSGPFNLEILTPGTNYPYLGLTGSSMPSPTDPDPYQQNLGRITQSNITPAGAPPTDVMHGRWPYSLYAETPIWKFDPITKEITATWISENLAQYPVHFAQFFGIGSHVDGLAFITNTLTYNDLLDLYLIPQSNQALVTPLLMYITHFSFDGFPQFNQNGA